MSTNATTQTPLAETYAETLAFNIRAHCERRAETATCIREIEAEIAATDGRKRSTLETYARRLEQAKQSEQQLREKVLALEAMETHVEELATIDAEISRLCARRRELTDNDRLHAYVKGKCYGLL